MASGHVNRTYRPNTWLHRPSLRREDFSCQPGAVHTWHKCEWPTASGNAREMLQGTCGIGASAAIREEQTERGNPTSVRVTEPTCGAQVGTSLWAVADL